MPIPIAESAVEAARHARSYLRHSLLNYLQAALLLVALVPCSRGEGHPFRWLAAALFLPLARFCVAAEYRRTILDRLRRLYESFETAAVNNQTPWLAAAVIVVFPALLLFLSNDRNSSFGDTWPVIPTASSVVTHGSFALDAYVDRAPSAYTDADSDNLPYCTKRQPRGIYSSYPSGMVPLAVPTAAVARLFGADLDSEKVQKHLEKWVASWVSAVVIGIFFLVALTLSTPSVALIASAFLATGSVVFSVCGQNLWQHDGVILWSLLAFWVELKPDLSESKFGTLIQGICCGMMAACRLSSVLFVVAFGLWVFARSPLRTVRLAVVSAACYSPWAWFYWRTYGTIMGPSSGQLDGYNWSWSLDGLWGILTSPSHGALVYQPWLLLPVAALLLGGSGSRARKDDRAPSGWVWLCVAVIALDLALVAGWRCWWGGYCWGSRLVAEAIPFAALLCLRPISHLVTLTKGRWVLASFAVCAFLMHAVAVYGRADHWNARVAINQHPEMLWSWSRAPFLSPFHRTGYSEH